MFPLRGLAVLTSTPAARRPFKTCSLPCVGDGKETLIWMQKWQIAGNPNQGRLQCWLEFARTKVTYTFNSSSGYLTSKQDLTPPLTWPAADVRRRPSSPEERPRCAPASLSRRITWFFFIIFQFLCWTTLCSVHLKMTVLHSRHQRRVVWRVPYMHTCTLEQFLQIFIWGSSRSLCENGENEQFIFSTFFQEPLHHCYLTTCWGDMEGGSSTVIP